MAFNYVFIQINSRHTIITQDGDDKSLNRRNLTLYNVPGLLADSRSDGLWSFDLVSITMKKDGFRRDY